MTENEVMVIFLIFFEGIDFFFWVFLISPYKLLSIWSKWHYLEYLKHLTSHKNIIFIPGYFIMVGPL